jgi:uncharacterized protein (UPF0276 family)
MDQFETNISPVPRASDKSCGIGLRSDHYNALIENQPNIDFIEIHPENYFGGGAHHQYLERARTLYPLSLHAVGLSLGSTERVCEKHLKNIKSVADKYEPFLISDHASWSRSGNAHLNDLLPLPYTKQTLQYLCDNIEFTQDFLSRAILVENPSTYISFSHNEMDEAAFMNEIASRTGCKILLDINNIFVQAHNHSFSAQNYIDDIKAEHVGELHLAGHIEKKLSNGSLLIDTHNQTVSDDVWELYSYAINKIKARPTLIEWDADLPELSVLVKHAHKARNIMLDKKVSHAA